MKVEVNGKTYWVETLIADNERLRKEIIESAKTNRLVLDSVRAEIEEYKSRTVFGIGIKDLETGKQVALDSVLGIIDRYRNELNEWALVMTVLRVLTDYIVIQIIVFTKIK